MGLSGCCSWENDPTLTLDRASVGAKEPVGQATTPGSLHVYTHRRHTNTHPAHSISDAGRWGQGSLARGSWPRLASEELYEIKNSLLIITGRGLRDNEQMPTGSSYYQAAGPNEKPTCLELGGGFSS